MADGYILGKLNQPIRVEDIRPKGRGFTAMVPVFHIDSSLRASTVTRERQAIKTFWDTKDGVISAAVAREKADIKELQDEIEHRRQRIAVHKARIKELQKL